MVRVNGINPNFKATTSDLEDLQNDINEAIDQIEQVEGEWDEYLTDEQQAELERLKATLTAESTALDGCGYYDPNNLDAVDGVDYAQRESLDDLGSGWTGGLISSYTEDADMLEGDDGDYMGTIEIEASGDPMNPTKLGFSADDDFVETEIGPDGTITEIRVSSRGRDMVLTIIGVDGDGQEVRKSWVIREGTVRPEPIIINTTELTRYTGDGVIIDASQTYRISDGSYNSYYGVTRGLYIHGTVGNDTIYGSQGDDKIVAWEGDDYIDAMAGNDTAWGDEYYDTGGSFSTNGGRDTIRGGVGNDTLYGGGNIDTRFRSDNPSATNPEAVYEFENIADDTTTAIPGINDVVESTTTGWDALEQDGMIVMENNDTAGGGNIDLSMPPGYNMAFAEIGSDGTSLVITFVGEDANGNPITFQMKIKNFMRASVGGAPVDVTRLNFTGSDEGDIIDFHKVQGTNNVVSISGGAGDDIIIGASNDVLSYGISYDDLLSSSYSGTSSYVSNEGVLFEDPEDPSGYMAEYNSTTGRIDIKNDPTYDANEYGDPHEAIRIAAPEGFETGFVAQDPATGALLIILINPTTKETIVLEIATQDLDYNSITVGNLTASDAEMTGDYEEDWSENFEWWPGLTPISLVEEDYLIQGGAGQDMAFAPEGTIFDQDVEEVVEGTFDGMGLNNVPNEDPNAQ